MRNGIVTTAIPPSPVPRSPMSDISQTPGVGGAAPFIAFPHFITMPSPPYGLLYSNTLTPVGFTNQLLDGEIVVGNTTGLPVAVTLTAGSGIAITNGPNSIIISATSTGPVWQVVDSLVPPNPIQILNNNGYICNGGVLVTFLLPLAPTIGDSFVLISNTARFRINENGSQQICIGTSVATAGSGNATSNSTGDAVEFIYLGNNIFRGFAPQGTITLN
jgi:hypothetical protein